MKKLSFNLKNITEKTPSKITKLANSILYALSAVAVSGLLGFEQLKEVFSDKELKWIIGCTLAVALICHALSHFFKEENSNKNTHE